jgi:hypothetical protein
MAGVGVGVLGQALISRIKSADHAVLPPGSRRTGAQYRES